MLAALAIGLGIAVGLLTGGSLRNLESASLPFAWAMLVLFVVQGLARGRLFTGLPALGNGNALWVATSLILLGLLAMSLSRPGILLVSVGILLNLDVVLLNKGMPVGAAPLAGSGAPASLPLVAGSPSFYNLATPSTLLVSLGDSIPLRFIGSSMMVSPGDVLLAVGIAIFVVFAMAPVSELPGV